uniref:Uncharacterized protein n=1 Tax=Candidatus Methanogaster sp. ANME-2c ERB4 TaxID=2759911 RepID=A0A7G9Y0F8_9EURY|nr:hypothetical protein PCHDJDJP_00015 [Methanosarcinales archaeon ANME-2c ERB4]QNO42076.1 hypothetical protein NOEFNAIN_00007 [Methanosarcinales archaeon ANME-2c ERB4]QNO42654.1 hypothetical protein LNAFDGMD_00015 [Methanosarcinales archaeon ANME-2c ERB4]QNO43403.1 hypothetical protein PNFJDKBC_00014 [Methanosarcinales archaeon ANME-2c ERB4]QNO48241.1 hypothetical protein BHCKGNAA_00026 [Methanosarcinales archaeon ANME-2c ERB4]
MLRNVKTYTRYPQIIGGEAADAVASGVLCASAYQANNSLLQDWRHVFQPTRRN